jgi:mannose-6-phosphate isomerase-like protein (cupin superfamily)
MKLEEILLNQDPKSGLPAHMSRWEVGPGGSSPLDHHRVRECWFIASGSGELTFKGEEKMEVAAGDILYFDSWESHEVKNTGQTTLSVFSIWWPGDPET